MRAAVHERYGPPSVMRIAEVARPEPGPRDLLVKVHASTMNRSDCGFRAAKPRYYGANSPYMMMILIVCDEPP